MGEHPHTHSTTVPHPPKYPTHRAFRLLIGCLGKTGECLYIEVRPVKMPRHCLLNPKYLALHSDSHIFHVEVFLRESDFINPCSRPSLIAKKYTLSIIPHLEKTPSIHNTSPTNKCHPKCLTTNLQSPIPRPCWYPSPLPHLTNTPYP
jgi:hypothetical protein